MEEDLSGSWMRLRSLPEDILADMPTHVRTALEGARVHNFDIELICAGARVPQPLRSPRRLVLIADEDGSSGGSDGPVSFDLAAMAQDIAAARRVFIVSTVAEVEVVEAAYAAAVDDLASGYDVALIVETERGLEGAWLRAVTSLRGASIAHGAMAAA